MAAAAAAVAAVPVSLIAASVLSLRHHQQPAWLLSSLPKGAVREGGELEGSWY